MQQKQTETDDQVKLKPILGIRPGIYLAAIYSIALIFILYLFLIRPGLKNPGALIVFKTEPAGAALRVNNVYMGTSPCKIFIPKGTHTLQAVLPGFETETIVRDIPSRAFGSLFFPLRYPLELTLKTNDSAAAFAACAADYAAWSFGGEPTASWQIPLSLSEGAYRAGTAANEELHDILAAASRFASTRAALRDLTRAKFLLDNGGLSPSPVSALNSASDILLFLSENPGGAAWLSSLLPPESASIIRASAWYKNEISAALSPADISAGAASGLRRLSAAGIGFVEIPAGSNINGFMISERPVSRAEYETFLNENPSWEEKSTGIPARGDEITEISWFAAEAYCQWFTKRLPSSMAGMEARLPSEAEWEYAAKNFQGMENSGWEWCADPFTPLSFIREPRSQKAQTAAQAVGSPERTIRRAADGASAAFETRSSLPPDISSPFVSLRLVIAEK